jgi:hypothetical protein
LLLDEPFWGHFTHNLLYTQATKISNNLLRGQCIAGLESLQKAPKKVMCKSIRVKLMRQWRSQEDGDAKNVECQSRKAAHSPRAETPYGL